MRLTKTRITKNQYLKAFSACVLLLAFIRAIFPEVASTKEKESHHLATDSAKTISRAAFLSAQPVKNGTKTVMFFKADGSPVKNRIRSVPDFSKAFPDLNDVQLEEAHRYGVPPVANRQEAERRKSELVYIAGSPFYQVDRLRSSIPYLVPRAAVLLHDIGRNFFDSLQVKGVPLHRFIVTSVLRSEADVTTLRGHNGNASENSCHRYGTTFDIAYNRYKTVEDPNGPSRRRVRNDTLKWVLSEVLNDLHTAHRCYIKYEVKQGCFHITVR